MNQTIGAVIRRTKATGTPGLRVFGPMDATGGYGQFVSAIAVGLHRLGHKVIAQPSMPHLVCEPELQASGIIGSGGDRDFVIHPPDCLSQMMRPGVPTAVMTMWESTRLRPEWVAALNRARVVIVPNEWNASCFSAQGVDVPIRVVGLGVDEFTFAPKDKDLSGPFTVGVAGRWASGGDRKGLQESVETFLEAFPVERDVRLQVKCFEDCKVHSDDPRVTINRANLSMTRLASWYQGLSIFLSMSRAEGWGLHQHQAMMCGTPLISPKFAGVAEFFERGGWQTGHELTHAAGYYEGLGYWCTPSRKGAIEALQDARAQWVHGRASDSPWRSAHWEAYRFTSDRMSLSVERVLKEFSIL